LIPRIESYLEDLNMAESKRELGVFSASDIGSASGRSLCGRYIMGCGRRLGYRYSGVEPHDHIDPRLRRIFDTGTMIHLQLQDYLKQIAARSDGTERFTDEKPIFPSTSKAADILDIISTTDGEYEIIGDDNVRWILEIKSINTDEFKSMSKPKEEHVVQSNVYMGCLDIPVSLVLYYDKNTSSMAEYLVKFDSVLWAAVMAKINYVRATVMEDNEPPQEPGFHCRTCPYAYVCKPPKLKDTRTQTGRRPRYRL
jgi:CRISPR/Cas system-associated exonuclease Cas4 (RecB family)